MLHRLLGQLFFSLQAIIAGLLEPKTDLILLTTIPTTSSFIGSIFSLLRKSKIAWWVMDINPDQLLTSGNIKKSHPAVRCLEFFNKILIKKASCIVTLDRFMAETLSSKTKNQHNKLSVIPPWPLETKLNPVVRKHNTFIAKHSLHKKFVVMYSGNHARNHPLSTIVDAAKELANESKITFVFIGSGEGKTEIDEFISNNSPANILSLPYQDLDQIQYSLSAGDLHIVSMGNNMIGINHPCKLYGAMALSKPILYLGSKLSPIGEIVQSTECGWIVEHGNIEDAIKIIKAVAQMSPVSVRKIGARGYKKIQSELNESILVEKFCDAISQ